MSNVYDSPGELVYEHVREGDTFVMRVHNKMGRVSDWFDRIEVDASSYQQKTVTPYVGKPRTETTLQPLSMKGSVEETEQ